MRADKAKLVILKALSEINEPAGSPQLADRLSAMGIELQSRTIRFYLLQLDQAGLTQLVSRRRGRKITATGREQLAQANTADRVGFLTAKIDNLVYQMSFNKDTGKGTIVINLAVIKARDLPRALAEMMPVFEQRLSVGARIAVARQGETIGSFQVPDDSVAFATVSNVTINGVLLREGIPVTMRFGGLVELRNGQLSRFVQFIKYQSTTLAPLEIFIKAGMTRVREAARNGSGIIGASFREIPCSAVDDTLRVHQLMKNHGLRGILAVGKPNRPLMDIPVSEGHAGMIVAGGLNPVAAAHEAGIRVSMRSLSGLQDFDAFGTFEDVMSAVKDKGKWT